MKKQQSMGDRIKALREHYGLTQAQFAAKVGATLLTVGNVERGVTQKFQLETMQAVVKKFGTTMEWLREGKGEMLPNGDHDLNTKEQAEEQSIYRDYALKRLEDEADTWKKKYEQVWKRLEFFLERLPLEQMMGKLNPDEETAHALLA